MGNFLFGTDLSREIRSILAEKGAKCAVAFWGRGCESWVIGLDCKVVATLRMGGTNPRALRNVRAEIRQCDTLHAKVYIGRNRAVVTSANASINGLALQGLEQASWIEAGILVEDLRDIRNLMTYGPIARSRSLTQIGTKQSGYGICERYLTSHRSQVSLTLILALKSCQSCHLSAMTRNGLQMRRPSKTRWGEKA